MHFETERDVVNYLLTYYETHDYGWSDEAGICEYQTESGGRCAIGVLVDEKIDMIRSVSGDLMTLETYLTDVLELDGIHALLPEGFPMSFVRLGELQFAHDAAAERATDECETKPFLTLFREELQAANFL